jgi:hypothetical protein
MTMDDGRAVLASRLEEPSQRISVFDAFRRSLLDDIHAMILSTHIEKQSFIISTSVGRQC